MFKFPGSMQIPPGTTKPLGVQVLESRGQFAHAYWYWIGIAALVGFTIVFNIGFTLAIAFMPPVGKPQAVKSEEELAEKEAIREGTQVLLKAPKQPKRSHPRRSLTNTGQTTQGELQLQQIQRNSSSLHRNGSSNNTSKSAVTRGMVLPFQPLSISFDDISYYVDMPVEMKQDGFTETRLKLLSNITGAFQPGVLTALVGVSGAGKTTLMDVLAGRKTGGYIEGDIRISGFPKNQKTFARISGYCEQNDIHSPQVTVRESLLFSAWLRLGSDIDNETKKSFVEQVMDLVEMKSLEYALVGLPGITGLSTEQRKRLTIAVELVANPSIIFMDEPTSGLDARAAAIVMRTVRNTVDTGRTVVCTIHQPSIDIFEAFDEVQTLLYLP
jgi:ABC-type multidrug transport system ATPase subunit